MRHSQIIVVTSGGPGLEFPGRYGEGAPDVLNVSNRSNDRTPCQCYQHALEVEHAEILIYIHDDVTIHDPDWHERVLAPFSNPNVVVVGLGGATSLGHPDLYKRPYRLPDMARGGYRSNQTDWQVHGEQEKGSCRVAVLDAFFMAVRREFLLSIGGWPTAHLTFHCLDLWLACEAARHGKETYMVGVSATHWGGGTSTKDTYRDAKWLQGGTRESDHEAPHLWLYETYRDCLPIKV